MTNLSQRLARYVEDKDMSLEAFMDEHTAMLADLQTLHALLVEAREALKGADMIVGIALKEGGAFAAEISECEYPAVQRALTRINAVLEKE